MRTIGIIQAIVRDQQVVEDLAPQDCPADDPWHVLDLDPSVPDPLRINHDRRAVLALLQATCVIGPDQRPEPGLLQLPLERVPKRLPALRITAATPVPGFADIPADKDMMGKGR